MSLPGTSNVLKQYFPVYSNPAQCDRSPPGVSKIMRLYPFYLVSTPIGSLDDLSFRAVEILRDVDLVLAEDTRKAKMLFRRYDIKTPVRAYHDHNKERVAPGILAALESGSRIALVADAGTPIISDPGYYLLRKLIEREIEFTAVPGASAVTTALVLSGLPPDRFTFLGYVPRRKGEREKSILEAGGNRGTTIFFETPHRLIKTLETIDRLLGGREVVVAREMTKRHEEIARGSAKELIRHFTAKAIRGEITLLIRGTGKRGAGGTA
jgi:16S rRNA (cytidine1402-2'-O)-methyltransferase